MAAGASLTYEPLPSFPTQEAPLSAPAPDPNAIENTLKDMQGKLLTNDGSVISDRVKQAMNFLQYAPEHIRRSLLGKQKMQEAKGDWATMNAAVRSAKMYDDIMKEKKDAMPEFAVYQGNVLAQDKTSGDIVEMNLDEYSNNLGKYKALTNNEVMALRERDGRFTGRDDLFTYTTNALSTSKIIEEIRKSLSDISSSTKGTTDVSFSEQQASEGAKKILTNTSSTGELFETNAAQLKAAGNAMWATLGDNAKDLLRIKAVHNGYKGEQIEGAAMGLALGLLRQKLQTKEITKESEIPGKERTKGDGGSDTPGEQGYYTSIANFDGAQRQINFVTGDLQSGRGAMASVHGFTFGPLKDEAKNTIVQTTLGDEKMGALRNIADFSQVTFGDQHVPLEKLRGVVYDGTEVATVMLPFKEVNKVLMPDFDRAQNYIDATEAVKAEGPHISKERRMEIYKEHGFNDLDPTGEPSAQEIRPFVMIENALTNNGVVKDSPLVETQNNGYLEDYYASIVGRKKDKYDTFEVPTPGWIRNTKVAKGNVFIPMVEGAKKKAQFADKIKVLVDRKYNMNTQFQTKGLGNNYGPIVAHQALTKNLSVDRLNPNK